jgi:DNA-binding GntR family transcriptional regulator
LSDIADGAGALSDRLVDELQRRILTGAIPVGSWLRHGAIAEEFGISRTPVREALRVLQAQGIVTIVQNRGARVNGHSGRDIRESGEVRAELEGLAAELAAARINDEQIERLRQAVKAFEAAITDYASDPVLARKPEASARWSETNEAFHSAVLDAAGSRQLALSIADINRRLPKNSTYPVYAGNSRLLQQNVIEHAAIEAAIVAHDGRRARQAMVKHIRFATESIARLIEDNDRDRDLE